VIEQTKDGFILRPEKTTNSTFVNGVEVPAGDSRILKEGDRIQFGFQGLELVFQHAER
jgi:predicted component of type VI protein secretion system